MLLHSQLSQGFPLFFALLSGEIPLRDECPLASDFCSLTLTPHTPKVTSLRREKKIFFPHLLLNCVCVEGSDGAITLVFIQPRHGPKIVASSHGEW